MLSVYGGHQQTNLGDKSGEKTGNKRNHWSSLQMSKRQMVVTQTRIIAIGMVGFPANLRFF